MWRRALQIDFDSESRSLGLDILRFLAISLVLLGHGDQLLRLQYPNFPNFWVIDGVDIFFVLSGFLIGGIMLNSFKGQDLTKGLLVDFWKRRMLRTIPVYFLYLFVAFVLKRYVFRDFCDFSTDYILFVQNFRNPHPYFFGEAWSLAVEEWFYVLFPVILYMCMRFIKFLNFKTGFLLVTIMFIVLPLLFRLKRYYFFQNNDGLDQVFELYIRKTVSTRLDAIAFGVLGAYILKFYTDFWKRFKYASLVLGIGILFTANMVFNDFASKSLFLITLNSIGVLLVLPFFSTLNSSNKLFTPITYISMSSYSIYLIHNSIVLYVFQKIDASLFYIDSLYLYVAYLFVSIFLAIISYNKIEKPFLSIRNRQFVI